MKTEKEKGVKGGSTISQDAGEHRYPKARVEAGGTGDETESVAPEQAEARAGAAGRKVFGLQKLWIAKVLGPGSLFHVPLESLSNGKIFGSKNVSKL